MNSQLPATEEAVEQAIRRFADLKFRQDGLVKGAAELDAIADRATRLEKELAELRHSYDVVSIALDDACIDTERERADYIAEAKETVREYPTYFTQAREEADKANKEKLK